MLTRPDAVLTFRLCDYIQQTFRVTKRSDEPNLRLAQRTAVHSAYTDLGRDVVRSLGGIGHDAELRIDT